MALCSFKIIKKIMLKLHFSSRAVVSINNWLSRKKKKEPWFVAFANFRSVNLLTITYFRILTSYWLVVLRYNSSLELVGAGPAAKFGGQPADWWPHPCGSQDHLRHPLCFLAVHWHPCPRSNLSHPGSLPRLEPWHSFLCSQLLSPTGHLV